ncbi:MAG: UDP-glucose 4-epimerase GalE [Pseudomonadota bacterium]
MADTILVTGGAGYIGSHACLALLEAGCEVIALDNLVNASEESLRRVQELAGKALRFEKLDLLNAPALEALIKQTQPDAVIHFAGLKAVGESVAIPLTYYANNLTGTLNLLQALQQQGTRKLVFSSTATVYGPPDKNPVNETAPIRPTNPYGQCKAMIEQMLRDAHVADPSWNIALLRYFNPVGAHPSGRIGEDPLGIPNNLMPFIGQVATGRQPLLKIFGDDYPTPDGTGVRDYLHVMDLVEGHLAALEHLANEPGCVTYNLGTGTGHSVLEMVSAFEKAAGIELHQETVGRRAGDVAELRADPSLANDELGWQARRGLDEMCRDTWLWLSNNPAGYNDDEEPDQKHALQ